MKANTQAVALTVAGSDSGGGAGIQADLQTFHALGVFGTSAITCVTAQNPQRLSAIEPLSPRIVVEQMERVFEAFDIRAVKTGMLFDAAIIEAVAATLRRHRNLKLVVDPMMVATSGARLLKKDAFASLCEKLFPLAALVTPNVAEAEVLAQRPIRSVAEMRDTASALTERFGVPFLIKGGHLPGHARATDVLAIEDELHEFNASRVRAVKTHGTGCVYSAAIAALLARGGSLTESVRRAKLFVTRAIRGSIRVGKFHVLNL